MLGGIGIGAGDQDAHVADVGTRRPDLRPVDHVLVAVTHSPGGEVGEIRTGVGFGEELTPDVLVGEDPIEVAGLLLLGTAEQDRRSGPADPDGVRRHLPSTGTLHLQPGELLLDDDLVDRVGADPPRLGPVRHDIAGLVQFGLCRFGVGLAPRSDGDAPRVSVGGKVEVHQ